MLSTQQRQNKRGMRVDQLKKTLAVQTQRMHRCDGLGSAAMTRIVRHQILIEKHLSVLIAEAITAIRSQLHQAALNGVQRIRRLATSKQDASRGEQQLIHVAMFSDQLDGGRHGRLGRQRE